MLEFSVFGNPPDVNEFPTSARDGGGVTTSPATKQKQQLKTAEHAPYLWQQVGSEGFAREPYSMK